MSGILLGRCEMCIGGRGAVRHHVVYGAQVSSGIAEGVSKSNQRGRKEKGRGKQMKEDKNMYICIPAMKAA